MILRTFAVLVAMTGVWIMWHWYGPILGVVVAAGFVACMVYGDKQSRKN